MYRLEPHLVDNLESVILEVSDTNIVITSSWREAYGPGKLKALFSAEPAARIEGVTPISPALQDFYRHDEIITCLKRRVGGPVRWIAIDDDPFHYPPGSPVLLTDPETGFDDAAAAKLADVLGAAYGLKAKRSKGFVAYRVR